MSTAKGKVYLVGAGPGDPKLLTLRGKECLEQADVVLYDYLANETLLNYVPIQAERIYVGRRGRGAYQDQKEVNRLMIEKALSGKVVIRLKGGDPFVFGRGGEEAEAVAEAGLEFEVVPGVTAAVAVPAYAGIPVTHRTLASTVAFVTGHEDPSKGPSALEWPRLATADGTVVFLMGMKNLPRIVERLVEQGRPVTTPVAVIRWGTRAQQQTVIGTLADIVSKSEVARLDPPTVIVVGDVVRLRNQLNWFEKRPLFGKRILVTRAREQAVELSDRIRAYGGEPVECPTIHVTPPENWSEVDGVLADLRRYQWLIFTSVNGVEPFMSRLRKSGRDVRALAGLRICCIGPRTAHEVAVYGLKADLIPAEYQAEGIIEALKAAGIQGQHVLIPRAAVAREVLPEELRALGAEVQVVTVYRTVLPSADSKRLKEQLRQNEIHVVSFTSSSTVLNFTQLFERQSDMHELMHKALVACIGPITAQTAIECGLSASIVARENTVPALADAIAGYYLARN
ncbi:MAG: uroporphyrinogen-III C-methyltransferase [Nitrospiraceae bacterium]